MAGRIDSLLTRLEAVRHRRPAVKEAQRLVRAAGRLAIGDAANLIRLHEALLFLRAYPHGPGVLRQCERLLRAFEKRVARLEAADDDLSAFDAPEVAGIAGTTVGTDFSFELARWLADRPPRRVRIDWDAGVEGDRMRATWPAFLPLLEEEALSDANVPYVTWRAAAAGRRRDELAWLLERHESLPVSDADRAERFDSLLLPIAWELGAGRASRTKMRLPGPATFFHDGPFLGRKDVSLDALLCARALTLRRLSRKQGERVCDMVREATASRYRELYQFTFADPTSVLAARPGRGMEIFLVGVRPGRRLPLRAAYGGFIVKNGVPIGYTEGLAVFDRLEIGFNMYYTFREGESAWIYAQMLKLHKDALGVTSFSVDPYQIGFENAEAIDSGAFWFYRKLGFRPTDAGVRRLLDREERRMASDPSHRSSKATLRRLVTHNLLYEVPGSPRGDWDRFHIRNLGLSVNRRMAAAYRTDARRLRASAEGRVAKSLGVRIGALSDLERGAFGPLALALDLVPDLARWSRPEKDAVIAIVRAKARGPESRYLRLLQKHGRLRKALIRRGSAGVRSVKV